MNESYQEAAILESKNLGEGTADYQRAQQYAFAGTLNAKVTQNFAIQPRLGGTLKGSIIGGPNAPDIFSNKQLLINAKTQGKPS